MKQIIALLTLLTLPFIPRLSWDEGVEEAYLKLALLNARAIAREKREEKMIETTVKKVQKLHGETIRLVAERRRFDSRIITAIVAVESAGNPHAKSKKGAKGLMQIRPIAVKEISHKVRVKNFYAVRENLAGGTEYLKRLKTHYGFIAPEEILLAYNRGPAEAKKLIASGYDPSADGYVRKVKTAFFYAAKHN